MSKSTSGKVCEYFDGFMLGSVESVSVSPPLAASQQRRCKQVSSTASCKGYGRLFPEGCAVGTPSNCHDHLAWQAVCPKT